MIYNAHVKHAKILGKNNICFWSTIGESHHPLKPSILTPVEPWGYVIEDYKPMNIELNLPWSTLQVDGSVKEEVYPVQFFMKSI